MVSTNGERLVTLSEAAELLGLKVATLRAWRLRRKNLNFFQVGQRCVRLRASDIEEFIRAGEIRPREVCDERRAP
jgi:excisionase family DNA binding protein